MEISYCWLSLHSEILSHGHDFLVEKSKYNSQDGWRKSTYFSPLTPFCHQYCFNAEIMRKKMFSVWHSQASAVIGNSVKFQIAALSPLPTSSPLPFSLFTSWPYSANPGTTHVELRCTDTSHLNQILIISNDKFTEKKFSELACYLREENSDYL